MRKLSNEEKQEVFLFLDNLRESGVVNMFGSLPYVQRAFPHFTNEEARHVLLDWMETFSARHTKN